MSSLPLPAFLSASTRRSSSRSTSSSPSTTLAEALRTNPFGTSRSKSSLLENDDAETRQNALNKDLIILADLFPDVKTEVLRELLRRFDGNSRIHVCVGQLLKYRAEWVKGRWNVPPREHGAEIPLEETFRCDSYKEAVKTLLYLEFRALSRSTIDAVVAEGNSSYSYARPILKELSKKTWRATLGNFNPFKKKKEPSEPSGAIFQKSKDGTYVQTRETGSAELDEELAQLFTMPVERLKKQEQEDQDHTIAETVNYHEAEAAEALYECDCCCTDITFEAMSTCTSHGHNICFDCIRRTIREAVWGQGWGKAVDAQRATLKCLALSSTDTCDGCITQDMVVRAISAEKSGVETWNKFQERLSQEALLKSQVKLVRCPFCSYAEADPLYRPSGDPAQIHWQFRSARQLVPFLTILLFIDFLPFFFLLFLFLSVVIPSLGPQQLFITSLRNVSLRWRCPRFKCRSPACSRTSCLRCSKAWHDPHVCHEPLLLSLRTTVEAARTAAIKRTCPRCGLSFVKASGCNKLTCVCGYAMCYLCRKSLNGPPQLPPSPAGLIAQAGVAGPAAGGEGEGYRHFCEHFRVNPGRPCDQCDKCDLYRAEDEDVVVKRAGEQAEKEWRIREGMIGVEGFDGVTNADAEKNVEIGFWRSAKRCWRFVWSAGNGWDVQATVDWIVDKVIVVEI